MKGDRFCLVEGNFADFIGEIDYMVGRELFQFRTRTEAPGDTTVSCTDFG